MLYTNKYVELLVTEVRIWCMQGSCNKFRRSMEALPRRVMLIYNERKKAVSLPPASSAERSDALLLEETARTLFLNGDPDRQILMQEFDDFFDDWVEIEKEAEVKDRQKIKIVAPIPLPHSLTVTDVPNVDNNGELPLESTRMEPEAVYVREDPELFQSVSDAESSLSGSTGSTVPVSKSRPSTPSTPSGLCFVAKRSAEPPLPHPFILPVNYSPEVMAGLQAGSLSAKSVSKFISEVASAVFNHKSYPTREEKVHVALQCLKKYPFLESPCGSGYGYLVIGLEEKFKYLRKPKTTKRASRTLPASDQEEPDVPIAPPPKKAQKDIRPSVSLHEVATGEDEASHVRNVKMLQSMFKLSNPDPTAVGDLMQRTFAFRRTKLETDSSFAVSDLLVTYPFLQQESQLILEFNRVVGSKNASFLSSKLKWLELVPKVLEVARKDSSLALGWLSEALKCETNDEGSDALLAAICLTYLLHDPRTKKEHSRVIRIVPANTDVEEAAASSPGRQASLLAIGSVAGGLTAVHIILEKKLFISLKKKTDGVPLLFAMYYVFHLTFEAGTQSFFQFLEYAFLNLPVGRKQAPQRLIALLGV